MYCSFYGFTERPFQLFPNPRYLYRSEKHKNALTHLEYGLVNDVGFIVITGEIGTGKTTLLKYMLQKLASKRPLAFLSQTSLNPEQLLRALCQEFSLAHEGKGKSELMELLSLFFIGQFSNGKHVLIVLDEAQNLSAEALEEVRMLSNLDADNESLLQIVLVGQPGLRRKLQSEELLQLSQRVSVNCHLRPLDKAETAGYIRYRMETAGCKNLDLFDPSAVESVYKYSGGVPRIINSLCDMCLVYGMADELKVIKAGVVESVLKDRADLDLLRPGNGTGKSRPENGKSTPAVTGFMARLDRLLASFESTNQLLTKIAAHSRSNGNNHGSKSTETELVALQTRIKEAEGRLLESERRQEIIIDTLLKGRPAKQ